MNQWQEVESLRGFLLELSPCNLSDPASSLYNFSPATVRHLFLEYQEEMFTLRSPVTMALIGVYVPTFLLALLGNALVIYVIFSNQHMRRVKNLFLANLAVADILVTLICIPIITGQTVYRLWIYGPLMCKLSGYMQGLAVTCSILTLSALSIDRYMAIRSPGSIKRLSEKRHVLRVLLVIWLLSALFASPLLYTRSVQTVEFKCVDVAFSYCIEDWPSATGRHVYGVSILVVIYVVPISIIAACYGLIGRVLCSDELQQASSPSESESQEAASASCPRDNNAIMLGRKRVARMLIVLIVVFVVCWLPYNACSLSLDLSPSLVKSQILPFTLWLGHAHSAINPPLYWLLNKSFRQGMRKVLRCNQTSHEQPQSHSPSYGEFGKRFGQDQNVPEVPPNGPCMLSLRDQLRMRNTPDLLYYHIQGRNKAVLPAQVPMIQKH